MDQTLPPLNTEERALMRRLLRRPGKFPPWIADVTLPRGVEGAGSVPASGRAARVADGLTAKGYTTSKALDGGTWLEATSEGAREATRPPRRRPPVEARPSHAALIRAGLEWLKGHGALVVTTEPTAGFKAQTREAPDVLAWMPDGVTWVLEAKASRADFLADAGKPWRRAGATALGVMRAYICPTGMVHPDELPSGWGLLVAGSAGAFVSVRPLPQPANAGDETMALLSCCRRLGVRAVHAVACRCFTFTTKGRTEVHIREE